MPRDKYKINDHLQQYYHPLENKCKGCAKCEYIKEKEEKEKKEREDWIEENGTLFSLFQE